MIIDLLTQKSILSMYSHYGSISQNMLSNMFTVKTQTDVLSWKLTTSPSEGVTIIFVSKDTVRLSEIEFEVLGGENNANHHYTISTSLDNINWYELPYRKDENDIVYKRMNDNDYINLTTYAITSDDYLVYAFKRFNTYSEEYEFIYDNLEFRYLKFEIDNVTATVENPIYFNKFKIYVEDFLNEYAADRNILEIKSDMFYQQKIFQEQGLYPDIIRNYLKMLEDNGTKNPLEIFLNNGLYLNMYYIPPDFIEVVLDRFLLFNHSEIGVRPSPFDEDKLSNFLLMDA